MVGNDSIDPTIVGAGEASMNFGGFAQGPPPGWEATVLHEFGHALGFQHEHQLPVGGCDLEFRWEDDPGYQPPPISSANSSSTPSSGDRASIPCSAARPTAGHRPRWTTTSASCATPMLHDRPVRPQLDHEVLLRGLDVRDGEQSHCFSQRMPRATPLCVHLCSWVGSSVGEAVMTKGSADPGD